MLDARDVGPQTERRYALRIGAEREDCRERACLELPTEPLLRKIFKRSRIPDLVLPSSMWEECWMTAPTTSDRTTLMKLLHHPFSTFSRRIRMQLIEKGISIDEQIVKMEAREHKGEAFRALNPYGRVPVLIDDDLVLFESSAIMDYLEQKLPTPALLPEDPKQRALVAMHVKLCDLEVGVHTHALFFPRRFFPRERWNAAEQDEARRGIAAHLAIVSAQLGEREYLVADRFTLADLAYCILTPFVALFELELPANVSAWFARIEARPSATATFPPR